MKRFSFLSLISSLSISSFSQNLLSENQKLKTLCKVWKFLKYHHPHVTKNKILERNNYYFPYKYLIGEDRNVVLLEMMERFVFLKETVDYHLAMTDLTAKINDCHAEFLNEYLFRYFGFCAVTFKINIIDEKAIITSFHNDSLSKIDDIRVGDVILDVNYEKLSKIISGRKK